ncbi:hypothetical protein ACFYMW_25760 [Streptomyces sp. NPDC006692]|uniref:hypothetical protein n=1 Tax=Streptomyces sp. NPDC006692 TaxID=3364758 RepID=UPI00367DA277
MPAATLLSLDPVPQMFEGSLHNVSGPIRVVRYRGGQRDLAGLTLEGQVPGQSYVTADLKRHTGLVKRGNGDVSIACRALEIPDHAFSPPYRVEFREALLPHVRDWCRYARANCLPLGNQLSSCEYRSLVVRRAVHQDLPVHVGQILMRLVILAGGSTPAKRQAYTGDLVRALELFQTLNDLKRLGEQPVRRARLL